MKSIYETKFDTVIEWIDEHVARGFYPLFDKRFRFGWRVANLILHDELRWLAIKIDNAYNEKICTEVVDATTICWKLKN